MQSVQSSILLGLTELVRPSLVAALNIAAENEPEQTKRGFRQRVWIYLIDPKNRKRAFLWLWVFSVVSMLALTLITLGFSVYVIHSYHVGVLVTVIAWALFFGVFVLFFLPPKLVTTFLGGLVGVSVSEVPSGAGLLSKLNSFVQTLVSQLITIVGGKEHIDERFAQISIWVFMAIMMVMCLPAFFGTEDAK